MMKKLKRFALNDARMLSREELAAIEGGLTIDAVDNCTVSTSGRPCVFYSDYNSSDAVSYTHLTLPTSDLV